MKPINFLFFLFVAAMFSVTASAQKSIVTASAPKPANAFSIENTSTSEAPLTAVDERELQKLFSEIESSKRRGRILLWGGLGLMTASVITGRLAGSSADDNRGFGSLSSGNAVEDAALLGLVVGTVSTLVSIPILVSSRNKGNYAASLQLSTPRLNTIQNNSLVSTHVPTLSLKVNL